MRRQPFALISASCQRCGRPVMTGNRSLIGADMAKEAFGVICSGCVTEEEERRMLAAQADAILSGFQTAGSNCPSEDSHSWLG